MRKQLAALLLTALIAKSGGAGAFTLNADETLALEGQLAADFAAYDTLGASVALIENGKVSFTYCYGERQPGGEAVTPDSGFQVGSISKMVANIGLMRLVERGNVGLEDELKDILGLPIASPYYPRTPITLRQLMTHTAGLRDSAYYDDALDGDGLSLSSMFEYDKISRQFHTNIRPGRKSIYSNFGGGLIGVIIESLTGETLDGYMRGSVFEPLGIEAAFQARLLPKDMPLCDIYYMPQKALAKALREDSTLALTPDIEHDYYFSAGKLIISAPDLAKLIILLCDGGLYENTRLLRESTVQEMRTPQNGRGSVVCDSNRGLFLNIITDDQVKGRTLYGHGGKAYGMLCAAYFDPTDRTGVVMLTNGCNQASFNGVGKLGRVILTDVYNALEQSGYQSTNPFSVE